MIEETMIQEKRADADGLVRLSEDAYEKLLATVKKQGSGGIRIRMAGFG